ncbi:hypothetical protein DICVIV_08523 [Dictyocaulus viviparus]|uniref:Uncharacterized protein n=1 Tax=Dictyocaulus viviparus TaxID=29172 RepID=A0A0D8XNR6_DICVI|nr:hypothetical protein DICVIV_08523 [Dictyocaulus viviparus]
MKYIYSALKRYGQQRRTYVYRLILNNCMEKAIFNRQISKHGLQQRIVDDAQVDANITQKELETLLMYDESLDVTSGKWDTSDWNFDDEVLESVVKRRSEILAEEPFLHESLILEREEGLSEEEKKEAELWFAKEQIKDVSENKGTQSFETNTGEYIGRYSRIPAIQLPHTSSPFVSSMIDAAPLRSTPVPYMIDRIPESLPSSSYGSSFRVSNMKDSGGMRNVIDRGLCNENFRVPSFPGAVVAFEPSSNSRGSVQLITTDRSLCLPIVSHPTETRDIPANTEALLVRSADGVFLRLRNGLLLNAQGSIFDSHPTKAYPSINIQPKLPQPLNLPPSLKTYPDIIELD